MNRIELAATWLLGRALGAADGVPASTIAAAEARLGVTVPAALKALHLAAGANTSLMSAFQQFLPPEAWAVFGDKLVFLEENQGVCAWAVDAQGRVFQAEDADAGEWHAEPCDIETFLHAVLHYQMAEGGYPFAGHRPADEFAGVEAVEEIISAMGGESVVDLAGLRIHRVGEQALVWYLQGADGLDEGGLFLSVLDEDTYARIADEWDFADLG